jgi:hypothetical protein
MKFTGEEKMQKWLKNPNNIDMVSSWQAVQGLIFN